MPLDWDLPLSPFLVSTEFLRPRVSCCTVSSWGAGSWLCWERGDSRRVGQVDCLAILNEQGVESLRSVRGVEANDMGLILVLWLALLRYVICISINIICSTRFIGGHPIYPQIKFTQPFCIVNMLQGYTKVKTLSKHLTRRTYLTTKEGREYFIQEYTEMDMADQTRYKIKQMLAEHPRVMPMVEHFEEGDKDYYVTEFLKVSVTDLMSQQPQNVFAFEEAYRLFKQIVRLVMDCQKERVIVRELQPQRIMTHQKDIKIYDFSKSFIVKRKRRMFTEFEGSPFTAPEALTEEGYSDEVDVWMCGVLLYYFLTSRFPFTSLASKDEYLEQINRKCGKGFKISENLPKHQHFKALADNSFLEHLFEQIFSIDPFTRISLEEMFELEPTVDFLKQSAEMSSKSLSLIWENAHQGSIFLSKLNKDSPLAKRLHRQQIILEFIEKSAQSFLLDLPKVFNEQLRYKVQSAVLKIAIMKTTQILEMIYGKRKPDFDTTVEEWENFRNSSVCQMARKKLQKKSKLLSAYHKSACLNIDPSDPLADQNIPESFDSFKPLYRKDLSVMYKIGREQLVELRQKKKSDQELRRMMESVSRVIIFYLINRLFDNQQTMKDDFSEYYQWSKYKDLTDLQEWIVDERVRVLQKFVVKVTTKYLGIK